MFSKTLSLGRILSLMLVLAGATQLVACGDFLKGQRKQSEVIELENQKLNQLQHLPENLRKLSLGEIKESEIHETFETLRHALEYFSRRTQGSVPDGYTVADIRSFFGTYFLKQNNVSPELAQEMMKFKKAIFGGSEKWITKKEIGQCVELLNILEEQTILLAPHFKVLLLKDKDKADWQKITAATDVLHQSLRKLLKNTELYKSDYSFEDAKNLVVGIANFISGEQLLASYQLAAQWGPLVVAIKNVLIGENARFAGIGDWNLALDNFIDLYEVALKHYYVVSSVSINDAQDLRQFSQFVGQIFRLFEKSYQMQKTAEIPFTAIDELVEKVVEARLLPKGLQVESIKKAYRIIVLRILEPQRNGDTRALLSLRKAHLQSLRREFNIWRLSQSFVDQIKWDSDDKVSRQGAADQYDLYDFDYVIRAGLERDLFEKEALRTAWKDFGLLLKSKNFVGFDEDGRLLITTKAQQKIVFERHSWKSLTKVNLIRSLSRILLIGYGDKGPAELSSGALSVGSLRKWYEEFNPIGQDLKIFDKRSPDPGQRSFLEANFFTFSGNGDERMDSYETFEFVSFLFGAGLGSSTQIQSAMGKGKCEISEIDEFGYPMMEETCFKNVMRANFAEFFINLPQLSAEVKAMTPAQWDEYYGALLTGTRVSPSAEKRIEVADLRTMVMVLHYVESLIQIYDRNGNQAFSYAEIETAFPRFASFLRKTNPGHDDTDLTDGFAYLLFYGAKPSTAQVLWLKGMKMVGALPESRRAQIIKVFQVLKADMAKPLK